MQSVGLHAIATVLLGLKQIPFKKTMYYSWNLYSVYGVCSYYSPGQMYSPCLCFDVELGKNKWHK